MHTSPGTISQTNPKNKIPLSTFLQIKKRHLPGNTTSINSLETSADDTQPSLLLPKFSFSITSYSIGQHVEYSVTLKEEFSVLRRKIFREYNFVTRYSKLERLDEKMGGMGLPMTKWFGNKKLDFVEKRKRELETYLNRIAQIRKAEFYTFVKQIKSGDFNRGLNQKFSIE